LRDSLYKEFPNVRKVVTGADPKRTYPPAKDLLIEARTVIDMIADAPSMPQRKGEVYHVVSMEWYQ
jgi:hypothetical protein